MNAIGWLQLALYFGALLALVKPLGGFMAHVYAGERTFLSPVIGPLERLLYRAAGVAPAREQGWQAYAFAFLAFNLAGFLAVYLLVRLQGALPLNPQGLAATTPDLAFNTAVSFASNTNWQSYGGETTLSYLTQMLGLTVQNFVSAASGMAVLVALARGIARRQAREIGNFWVDMTRSVLYVLLPLSLVGALVLVSQGVVQTFGAYPAAHFADAVTDAEGRPVLDQVLAVGPAASQIIIKQLGTNGGGFFNANSAHPFENPTPLSNFVECLSILLIPAALTYTFGKMVGDARQGWALLAAMVAVFVPLLLLCTYAELAPNPQLAALGIDQAAGNLEGKEARFGVVASALWATATTAASNGSVNAMHDSFTPLGGLATTWLMQLGEVIFGGVGSGLYGMFMFAVVAVFVAGLMVGRTPEYAGKKIEAHEMKMASLVILVPAAAVLIGTALACVTAAGQKGPANPGAHGFSEILYAFSSAANNNGSAFAGLSANTPFYNTALGVCMLFGRYWVAVPVLALAGSLAKKKFVPPGAGTLPTHTPLFVGLVVGTVMLVGALTFLPALALGPVVEHVQLYATGGR
ncbi:MAG: potassium-transporting ATPase subunit KdpA [Polyangiaceae bacterium]|jgi:potassium-transporting ATPase potassium-binding subunit|nr:potassium-transporting ATPase subunit KdpA [Polyangiaceae bacterium]